MNDFHVIAVKRTSHYYYVKVIFDSGAKMTKFIRRGDNIIYNIARTASELTRDADYEIFGEDARWLWASTPKKVGEGIFRKAQMKLIDALSDWYAH